MICYVNFKGNFYLCTPHRYTIWCVHSPPKFQIVFNLNNHQCFKSFLPHVLKKMHYNYIKLLESPEFVFSFLKCNHYLCFTEHINMYTISFLKDSIVYITVLIIEVTDLVRNFCKNYNTT